MTGTPVLESAWSRWLATGICLIALSGCSRPPQTTAERAEYLMRQQDFAAAAEVWEEQLKTDPRDISAWRGLGQCRIAQAQYPDAIKAFTAAIELDPDDSELYLYRSDVYRHLGDEDAALADFQRGNQLHSDAWARVSPDAGAVAVGPPADTAAGGTSAPAISATPPSADPGWVDSNRPSDGTGSALDSTARPDDGPLAERRSAQTDTSRTPERSTGFPSPLDSRPAEGLAGPSPSPGTPRPAAGSPPILPPSTPAAGSPLIPSADANSAPPGRSLPDLAAGSAAQRGRDELAELEQDEGELQEEEDEQADAERRRAAAPQLMPVPVIPWGLPTQQYPQAGPWGMPVQPTWPAPFAAVPGTGTGEHLADGPQIPGGVTGEQFVVPGTPSTGRLPSPMRQAPIGFGSPATQATPTRMILPPSAQRIASPPTFEPIRPWGQGSTGFYQPRYDFGRPAWKNQPLPRVGEFAPGATQ